MAKIIINLEDVDIQTENSFKQLIISAVENFSTGKISIKDYNLSMSVARELMYEIAQSNPEYFYFEPNNSNMAYDSDFYDQTGVEWATSVYPAYIENAQNKAIFVEQVADEIISGINDSMNDIEKALYIHDYIILNYAYDERIYDAPSSAIYDIYNFFEQKIGACQAYAQAYQYIMQYKLGISTIIVTSGAMGHMWNVIQIDGNWYHVDVTWDDPVPDAKGRVSHNHLLVSDSRISYNEDGSPSHYNWNYPRNQSVECFDTTYDAHWWRDVTGQIYIIDGLWYSIDGNNLFCARDVKSGEIIENAFSFTVEEDKWYLWNNDWTYWNGNYSVVLKYGDIFIYNLTEDIYAINSKNSKKKLIANIPKSEHNNYLIYGLEIDENGMLYAILQNNPQPDFFGNPVMSEKIFVCNVNDITFGLQNIRRGNRIPKEIQRVVNGEMKKAVAVYRVVNGSLIKFWEE